jgi:UDPglucose 6-dehydrogenase
MAFVEVVGQGFVGLATAILAADAGHDVTGIEVDPGRAGMLRAGIPPFAEPGVQIRLRELLETRRLTITGAAGRDDRPATLIVTVPTPTLPQGSIDDSALISAFETFAEPDRHELIVLRSTVPPGHSASLLRRFPELNDLYVYWPEFLNQGRALQETRQPDRIVVGTNSTQAAGMMRVLLKSFGFDPDATCWHTVMEAEAVKQFSNAALAVNQVLGAEIAQLCEQEGLDARAVLASVSRDSRLSRLLLSSRPPLVDSCLRKDLTALVASMAGAGRARILSASLQQALSQRQAATGRLVRHMQTQPSGAAVLIIGAGFSPGVSDTKGSLLWDLLPALEGYPVEVWDPYAEPGAREDMRPASHVADLPAALERASVVVLLVDHPEVYEIHWPEVTAALARRQGVILDYCASFADLTGDDPQLLPVVHGFGFSHGCRLCAA